MAKQLTGGARAISIAPGTFRVLTDESAEIVYVAGPPDDRWAFWNGHVFRSSELPAQAGPNPVESRATVAHSLTSPVMSSESDPSAGAS
jgi:hypothetical protein